MSDNTGMQAANDSNEWINWIEDAISKKHIKRYEYEDFHNIEKIGNSKYGEIYHANWKNSKQYFALKSFILDITTAKEIIHEVIINNLYFYVRKLDIEDY